MKRWVLLLLCSAGATLLIFGNGGSATDANDWAIDCVSAPPGQAAIPALSLSMDPASVTAIASMSRVALGAPAGGL